MKTNFIYSEEYLPDFKPKFEASGCFLEFEDKFLLLRRQDHKPQPDTYGLPSGKLDEWEGAIDATSREILEETSVKVGLDNLEFVTKLFARYPDYDFIYHIYKSKLNTLPVVEINNNEHKSYLWVTPLESLNLDLIPWLDICIQKCYDI